MAETEEQKRIREETFFKGRVPAYTAPDYKYKQGLADYLDFLGSVGLIDDATDAAIIARAKSQLATEGLTPNLPYYEMVQAGKGEWERGISDIIYPPETQAQRDEREVQRNLAWQQKSGMSIVSGRPLGWRSPEAVYSPPAARYAPAFETTAEGIGGTQPWKDWFRERFGSLASKYEATLPRQEKYFSEAEALAETQRTEKGWAEYLRTQTPKLREEYATRYPYGMGAKPTWALQPKVKTVSF